jgi:hypothetical protein
MGKDHNYIVIGNPGIVEIMCQRVRGFINLFVGKATLGAFGRSCFDNACTVGVVFIYIGLLLAMAG